MQNPATDLGQRIKRLRKGRGLSLAGLAARSGVSRSMISKAERGEANPTAAVLGRLAEALEVGISQLMAERDAAEVIVIRAAAQPVYHDPVSGFERRSVSPSLPSRGVDVVLNRLPKGASTGVFPAHRPGVQEHLVVVQGRIRARLGPEEHVLEAGDSLYFQAHIEHGFDNLADGESAWYLIIDSSGLRG